MSSPEQFPLGGGSGGEQQLPVRPPFEEAVISDELAYEIIGIATWAVDQEARAALARATQDGLDLDPDGNEALRLDRMRHALGSVAFLVIAHVNEKAVAEPESVLFGPFPLIGHDLVLVITDDTSQGLDLEFDPEIVPGVAEMEKVQEDATEEFRTILADSHTALTDDDPMDGALPDDTPPDAKPEN